MATITTRINGTASQAGYEYYLLVMIDDTITPRNTFVVNIDAWIVNHGSRTNTNGWTKQTQITDVGSYTDTNQKLNTANVDMYGGETLAIRNWYIYEVPITSGSIYVSSYMSKSSYASYDPGYCSAGGYVTLPKVQSTWASSLLSIPNVEGSFTLPINKYVSDYYDEVKVTNIQSTYTVRTITNAYNGQSITFTSSQLNDIYILDNNRNQLPLIFYLDLRTYTNSSKTTQIGQTQRLKCEAYLTNSNPSISATLEEQDENVISFLGGSSANKIIKNASDLLFTITAITYKSATIKNVKITYDGIEKYATYDSQSGKYLLNLTDISNVSTGLFNIVATDSRNLQSTGLVIAPTVLDYIALKINSGWTIERITPISSDFKLNAVIDCWSSTIDNTQNTPTVQYSIDNENWTTISSSSYTFADNKITITNLTIENLMSYQDYGKFYLKVTDLLGSSQDNKDISRGIPTFSYGNTDLQVNGDLIVADEDGNNPVYFNNINSGLTNILCNDKTNIQTTAEQTLISTTLNKGTYLFSANVPINYNGGTGREINLNLFVNNIQVVATTGVCNTNIYTLSRPIMWMFNITSDYTSVKLNVKSTTSTRYDVYGFNAQILRLK